MQRLIAIFDLAFLLLGVLSVSIVMLSPVYKVLSVDIPEAEGGTGISERNMVNVAVSPTMVSIEQQKFADIDTFKQSLQKKDLSKTRVRLSVDSEVAFSRLARILGILKTCGVGEILFEIKEGEEP